MLAHNLTIIYRNFLRYKMSFAINLIGLSIGLTCTLLIYLWVQSELGVDKFHENDTQLVQVMENVDYTDEIETRPETPDLLAETLAESFPEIKYAAAVTGTDLFGKFTLSINEDELKTYGRFAGKDYFNMFSFDLTHGDKGQVLADKNGIVISESLASKLFKTSDNILGETIEWNLPFYKAQSQVTGVFKDLPENSTEYFDFLIPFEVFKDVSKAIGRELHWDNHAPHTYLVLNKDADLAQLNTKVASFIQGKAEGSNVSLFLKKYSDNYLHGNYENGQESGGRVEYVNLFSIIAIFILIMACINFMNLSTAKASKRIMEVGVKKAIGADRKELIMQYLQESFVMTLLSFIFAIVLVYLFLPQFNSVTGKELSLAFNSNFFLYSIGVILFTSFVAGSYPAFYLSSFNPATVLKGTFNTSIGAQIARKGLVIFQFVLSIILIISVLVVNKQINFLFNQNLGYNKDNIIYFAKEKGLADNSDAFLNELKKIPGVKGASGIGENIIGSGSSTGGIDWEGKKPGNDINFSSMTVDHDLIETLGMAMKDGRAFSRDMGAEQTKIIFNERAIEIMGLKNPIGKKVTLWDEEREIIGVVKDFHFESFHESVKPLFIRFDPAESFMIVAKIQKGLESQTIADIKGLYGTLNPGALFEYGFLDEDFQAQYATEKRVGTLSKYSSGLAILISCLGLFGLAVFTTERRLKEIGIRKILGASNWSIVYHLSKDFTKIVLWASLFALPISYFAIKSWLSGFAYRVDIEPWIFIIAVIASLVIAWVTVASQAIKATRSDPVQCIRT